MQISDTSFIRWSVIGLVSLVTGCCAPHPTLDAVRSWARDDLPAGTSHEKVLQFCSAHGFSYFENDPHVAMATKNAGGCPWQKAMVWMEIAFDDNRRVASVHVWSGRLEGGS